MRPQVERPQRQQSQPNQPQRSQIAAIRGAPWIDHRNSRPLLARQQLGCRNAPCDRVRRRVKRQFVPQTPRENTYAQQYQAEREGAHSRRSSGSGMPAPGRWIGVWGDQMLLVTMMTQRWTIAKSDA